MSEVLPCSLMVTRFVGLAELEFTNSIFQIDCVVNLWKTLIHLQPVPTHIVCSIMLDKLLMHGVSTMPAFIDRVPGHFLFATLAGFNLWFWKRKFSGCTGCWVWLSVLIQAEFIALQAILLTWTECWYPFEDLSCRCAQFFLLPCDYFLPAYWQSSFIFYFQNRVVAILFLFY